MATRPREGHRERKEVQRAATRSPSQVEQVHGPVRRAMERARTLFHPAQSLDGNGVELAQSSPHRTGIKRRCGDGKSLPGATWWDLVAAYSGREAVPLATKDRKTSHDHQR